MTPKREPVHSWLRAALDAVEPRRLTARALAGQTEPSEVVAIGKAAAAMCWGAVDALGEVSGLCVTNHDTQVPDGVELIIGNHPIPGQGSLAAGKRALELAPTADLALISGGGSALCEVPIEGVTLEFLADATRTLLNGGASIEQLNLVRGHLSRVKFGGLGPLATYVLSDVSGQPPGVVSSGPTIPAERDPDQALTLLEVFGVPVPPAVRGAILAADHPNLSPERVEVIGDGRTAAAAVLEASGEPGVLSDGWVTGELHAELADFIESAPPGVSVTAGEPMLEASGDGVGGRNSHAALLAALTIQGTDWVFAAFATDGVDGTSRAAGAVVDGTTLDRGGDPTAALAAFDSATYLEQSGDQIITGPTGTNVADVWLIWKT